MTDIAMEFKISESTVHKYIQTFCDSVLNNILNQLISSPNQSQMTKTIAAVQERSEIPNVIGFIDGTCTRTNAPNTFLKFTSVKKFYAMQLLAVCQEDWLFTHVYTGWPGSCHDQRVLENEPFSCPEIFLNFIPKRYTLTWRLWLQVHKLGHCRTQRVSSLHRKTKEIPKKNSKIKNEYRTCFWSFEGQIQATHVA